MSNKKRTVRSVFGSQDKGISGTENILARLFGIIALDYNVGMNRFQSLMSRYINKFVGSKHPEKRANERGNFTKQLISPRMTNDAFLKGLSWLGCEEVEFSVRLRRRGTDKFTEHRVRIENLDDYVKSLMSTDPNDSMSDEPETQDKHETINSESQLSEVAEAMSDLTKGEQHGKDS